MKISPWILGLVVVSFLGVYAPRPAPAQTQQGDSLHLLPPANVRVVAQMNSDRRSFTNYLFWDDLSKTISTLIHEPDTTGWHPKGSTIPPADLSLPGVGGAYTGNIDRTLTFLSPKGGRVGVGVPGRTEIPIRYAVDGGREDLTGEINIGTGYTPGQPIQIVLNPGSVNLGFTVSFSAGVVDSNATFRLGMEDFDGYHMFRATRSDASDLINIGEISKEDAFVGEDLDSLYFAAIIPALRSTGVYSGFGTTIDIRGVHPLGRLGTNELFWLDSNAFNGFTYRYLVTTYDRDYNVKSSTQGLSKLDHCPVTQGSPYACPSELLTVENVVDPQGDLPSIYAVPNPYRSGSSQLTTENYHNFPDNKLRFVNVPAWCELKVYTPAGDLVWEFSQTDGPGNIEWDTRNKDGQEVASGVYIYRIQSQSGNWMYGRIIIIR